MGAQAVRLHWAPLRGRQCLLIVFYGRLTTDEAVRGGDQMKAEVEASDEPVTIVWDCREMTNYSARAFVAWKTRLGAIAGQVDLIRCVSTSSFIKLGASALGLAIGKSIKTVASLEALDF
ncbi:MAG: hypothetical protein JRI68_32190 [Deltaproteobacteria bacterium]|nr:hypothetical protein [Deltaproteobacteria bacterium]